MGSTDSGFVLPLPIHPACGPSEHHPDAGPASDTSIQLVCCGTEASVSFLFLFFLLGELLDQNSLA